MDKETVRKAAADGPVYQMLLAKVTSGEWEDSKSREIFCLHPFYSVRDRLAVSEGLLTYTYDQGYVHLVIPEGLRSRVASNLPVGHQGLDSMLRKARQTVYWPGMEGDIQHCRVLCESCDVHSPSLPQETMELTPSLDYPFQHTVIGMFQREGHTYMAYADRLTGWLEVPHLPNGATSNKIQARLRRYFTRCGAPEQMSTDGGTNLVSADMEDFYKNWGVSMWLSSAQYPQSNGRAEASVKTAKRIIRDNTSPGGSLDNNKATLTILQYLNTPLRSINKSPTELATGR